MTATLNVSLSTFIIPPHCKHVNMEIVAHGDSSNNTASMIPQRNSAYKHTASVAMTNLRSRVSARHDNEGANAPLTENHRELAQKTQPGADFSPANHNYDHPMVQNETAKQPWLQCRITTLYATRSMTGLLQPLNANMRSDYSNN